MSNSHPEYDRTMHMRRSERWWEPLVSKRFIACMVAIIFGGGGLAAWNVATKDDVEKAILESRLQTRMESDLRYQKIDTVVTRQGQDIAKIKGKVDAIQNVQKRQIARQEARRVTAGIQDREDREQAYDRILDLNLRRLSRGNDPCATLTCEN